MPVSLKFFNIDYYNYNRKISLSDKPELYIFGVILCFNKCIHCIMNIYILKYMNYEHKNIQYGKDTQDLFIIMILCN